MGGQYQNKSDMGCGDVDWINLALDREQTWSLVNIVMNHRIPQKQEYYLIIRGISSFLKGSRPYNLP